MRLTIYIDGIRKEMLDYRDTVNAIAKAYAALKSKTENTAREMRKSGDFSEQYIDRWTDEQMNGAAFLEQVENARGKATAKVDYSVQKIEQAIRDYISIPPRQEFANKLSVIRNSGVTPTNSELQFLWDDARSYSELRAVDALAAGRTKTEQRTVLDPSDPSLTHYENVTVPDPYTLPGRRLIDIEELTQKFQSLKSSVYGVLKHYHGEGSELLPLAEDPHEVLMIAVGENYFKNDCELSKDVRKTFASAESITDEGREQKKPLSSIERRFLDSVINPEYPNLAESKARDLARTDSEIRDLLLRDPRYEKIAQDAV